jgi:hypothetical protein
MLVVSLPANEAIVNHDFTPNSKDTTRCDPAVAKPEIGEPVRINGPPSSRLPSLSNSVEQHY